MFKQNQPLYDREQLNQLKMALEIEVGAKLSKLTLPPKVKFICKANPNHCPFEYVYSPVDDILFRLESHYDKHLEECYLDQEARVLAEQMLALIKAKAMIEEFLIQRSEEGSLQKLQPKKLLPVLVDRETGCAFDLYGKVQSFDGRRKLKKKFDNLVNESKAKLLNRKKLRNPEDCFEEIPLQLTSPRGAFCVFSDLSPTKKVPKPTPTPTIPNPNPPSLLEPPPKNPNFFTKQKRQIKAIEHSPRVPFQTACSRRSSFTELNFNNLLYHMTPPRLLGLGSFRHIFDSSPRMLREEFDFCD